MPLINVKTSLPNIENSELLLMNLSKELSNLTGKPEQFVMTLLQTNVPMTFAGSTEACCYVEIKSIGSIDSPNNKIPALFDTKAEAEKAAKDFTCKGAHKMGDKWMPCKTHKAHQQNKKQGGQGHPHH